MKKNLILILASLTALTLITGCKKEETPPPAPKAEAAPAPQAQPAMAPEQAAPRSGQVIETMNSGGYTYVQVDTGSEKFWAAAPEFAVKVGDPVVVPAGMSMPNYHSKTLDRDFEVVYFVDSVMVGGEAAMGAGQATGQMPAGHPPLDLQTAAQESGVDLSGIAKAEGGNTVAEVFAGKADLTGKKVSVRGKVVKFSPKIMGKNWIHIQDGTGEPGANDLTVTTDKTAAVGDTVLVSGMVTTDKDFGYGYKYDVILEDAEVKTE